MSTKSGLRDMLAQEKIKEAKMKGYNLPESTGPNDPDAPWNRAEQQEPAYCPHCRQEFPTDEEFDDHDCTGIDPQEFSCAWLLLSGRCGQPNRVMDKCIVRDFSEPCKDWEE